MIETIFGHLANLVDTCHWNIAPVFRDEAAEYYSSLNASYPLFPRAVLIDSSRRKFR